MDGKAATVVLSDELPEPAAGSRGSPIFAPLMLPSLSTVTSPRSTGGAPSAGSWESVGEAVLSSPGVTAAVPSFAGGGLVGRGRLALAGGRSASVFLLAAAPASPRFSSSWKRNSLSSCILRSCSCICRTWKFNSSMVPLSLRISSSSCVTRGSLACASTIGASPFSLEHARQADASMRNRVGARVAARGKHALAGQARRSGKQQQHQRAACDGSEFHCVSRSDGWQARTRPDVALSVPQSSAKFCLNAAANEKGGLTAAL